MVRSKCSLTALARTAGVRVGRAWVSPISLHPIFSTRTLSAASVGSPTLLYADLSYKQKNLDISMGGYAGVG